MDIESNLLFAVLAMQADLIDDFHFWEALRQWIAQVEIPLADLLVERQWISVSDTRILQQWLERKREKYGTARAALAACPGGEVPLLLEHLDTPEALASAFDHTLGFSPEFMQAFVPGGPRQRAADRRTSVSLVGDLSSGNARSLRTLFTDQPARDRRRGAGVACAGRRFGPERGTEGTSPGVGE